MSQLKVAETAKSVLLVGLEAGPRDALSRELRTMRWRVECVAGGAEALDRMEQAAPAAIILDHWLPDLEVNGFAAQVAGMYPGVEVVRINDLVKSNEVAQIEDRPNGQASHSAWRRELLHVLHGREVVESTQQMYLPRLQPFSTEPIPVEVAAKDMGAGNVLQLATIPDATPEARRGTTRHETRIDGLVGESDCMRDMCHLIGLVAGHRATVLIQGETGTGKELVAQAVHRLSPRAGKPMAVLNCAAIPEALLEAELFGHTRGAFTGAVAARMGRIEAAQGGTLFLDEIGEMPLALQAKMLRFLECGELQRIGDNETLRVDVRIVAATHQDLEMRSEEGTFRLDLYHRLAVFPIDVPPLRARREDIALLSKHMLAKLAVQARTATAYTLLPEALERLLAYDWPGNVRELGHTLERATILADGRTALGAEHIRLRRGRSNRL